MPDLTNDELRREIARQLRDVAGLENIDIPTVLRALADELQPKPEFKLGDWVVFQYRDNPAHAFRVSKTSPQWRGSFLYESGNPSGYVAACCTLIAFNVPKTLALIHKGEPFPGYISTDGLPELPKGFEYATCVIGDRVCLPEGTNAPLSRNGKFIAVGQLGGSEPYDVAHLIVRRKNASEQPSPRGES